MSAGEIIAIVISAIALIVSLLAFWMNILAPFKLRVMNDQPTFSMYKITPNISGNKEGKTWWIPSFDLGMSFYNIGRRPGEIIDIRIVGKFDGHRTSKKFYFYPKWIVDCSKFQEYGTERFDWIEKAVIREWYPILLKGASETQLHIILEGDRWDHIESGEMSLSLEVATTRSQWKEIQKCSLSFHDDIFETKCRYTAFSPEVEELRKL